VVGCVTVSLLVATGGLLTFFGSPRVKTPQLNKRQRATPPQIRTTSFESKFHLVDLAGSERVKRSGVTGQVCAHLTAVGISSL